MASTKRCVDANTGDTSQTSSRSTRSSARGDVSSQKEISDISDNNGKIENATAGVIFDHLASTVNLKPWWFPILTETVINGENCQVCGLNEVFGLDNDVMIHALEIAGLISLKKRFKKYSVNLKAWEDWFTQRNLTNRIIPKTAKVPFVDKDGEVNEKVLKIQLLCIGRMDAKHMPKHQKNSEAPKYRIATEKNQFLRSFLTHPAVQAKVQSILHEFTAIQSSAEEDANRMDDKDEAQSDDAENVDTSDNNEDVTSDDESNLARTPTTESMPADKEKAAFDSVFISYEVDPATYPMLSRIGSSISEVDLQALIRDITKLNGNKSVMSYAKKNGKPGCLVDMPQCKSYENFKCQLQRTKWFEGTIQQCAPQSDDDSKSTAVEWLCRFLAEQYEVEFVDGADQAGLPVVSGMTEVEAAAMQVDSNINTTQFRIVKRHLRKHFGTKCIAPGCKCNALNESSTAVQFGSYVYEKEGKKPERIEFWSANVMEVIAPSVENQLKHQLTTEAAHTMHPYELPNGQQGWEVLFGADHGQGSWRSWVCVLTADRPTRQKQLEAYKVDKSSNTSISFTRQVAHIQCRKDKAEILRDTGISRILDDAYTKLNNSKLLCVSNEAHDVECVWVPKGARDTELVKRPNGHGVDLQYTCVGTGFTFKNQHELKIKGASKVEMCVDSFQRYIVGDLAFFFDVQGRPNQSPHRCYLCSLKVSKWHADATCTGTKWTLAELSEALQTMQDGVTEEPHYTDMEPWSYIIPILHTMIGITNKAWDDVHEWVDLECEQLPEDESDARARLTLAQTLYESTMDARGELEDSSKSELRVMRLQQQRLKKEIKDLKEGEQNVASAKEEELVNLSNAIKTLVAQVNASKLATIQNRKNRDDLKKLVHKLRTSRNLPGEISRLLPIRSCSSMESAVLHTMVAT